MERIIELSPCRYFKVHGRTIVLSRLSKSAPAHTIREFRVGSGSINLGEPLTNLQGVLRGVPTMVSNGPALLRTEDK